MAGKPEVIVKVQVNAETRKLSHYRILTNIGKSRPEGTQSRRRGVATKSVVNGDPGMCSEYLHRCHSKAKSVAKVAAARKLAIRLYWMLRSNTNYPEVVRV
ncbi:MAG TPA: hypothetical protein VGI46_14205 [Candidatus Acidoferrum sp.]|jgi:hypothetical protein